MLIQSSQPRLSPDGADGAGSGQGPGGGTVGVTPGATSAAGVADSPRSTVGDLDSLEGFESAMAKVDGDRADRKPQGEPDNGVDEEKDLAPGEEPDANNEVADGNADGLDPDDADRWMKAAEMEREPATPGKADATAEDGAEGTGQAAQPGDAAIDFKSFEQDYPGGEHVTRVIRQQQAELRTLRRELASITNGFKQQAVAKLHATIDRVVGNDPLFGTGGAYKPTQLAMRGALDTLAAKFARQAMLDGKQVSDEAAYRRAYAHMTRRQDATPATPARPAKPAQKPASGPAENSGADFRRAVSAWSRDMDRRTV